METQKQGMALSELRLARNELERAIEAMEQGHFFGATALISKVERRAHNAGALNEKCYQTQVAERGY